MSIPTRPGHEPVLPSLLRIGDWDLTVHEITETGTWDPRSRTHTGVTGTAWTRFACSPTASGSVPSRRGQFLVAFTDVAIRPPLGGSDPALIVRGSAVHAPNPPTRPPLRPPLRPPFEPERPARPAPITLTLDGITVEVAGLTLTPRGATATVTLLLPGLGSTATCAPARLPLGMTAIAPTCAFRADLPGQAFGPWLVGGTGLVVTGTGVTVTSTARGLPTRAPRLSVALGGGTASGTGLPLLSNTGYLAATWTFPSASVTKAGLSAHLGLTGRVAFEAVNPWGYAVEVESGTLGIVASAIAGGELGPGRVTAPMTAVCDGTIGTPLTFTFQNLTVAEDLDLFGPVASTGKPCWGEFTHPGREAASWQAEASHGYLYLPGGPVQSWSPLLPTGFAHPVMSLDPVTSREQLEAYGMAGLTLYGIERVLVFSPDRPGGPLDITDVRGWLRLGTLGVDGEVNLAHHPMHEPLGDPNRVGYVGKTPFDSELFCFEKHQVLAQWVTSAVHHSSLDGRLTIPAPCDIPRLTFRGMNLTSTAHLVGGDVVLPVGGVTLAHWGLDLVPTGDPDQAGVVSVRTGRLVFTAAGLAEPVHFARPFGLTWGEMLASGNLGELFFDHNSWGQRFDSFPYTPEHLAISPWAAGATASLLTCGTVHFEYFGPHHVTIDDAVHAEPAWPYLGRYVTIPKTGNCAPTDLHLTGSWQDSTGLELATFDFPDSTVGYHESIQHGFLGTGSSLIRVLGTTALEATIELTGSTIDICLTSTASHDVDLGLLARLAYLTAVHGCIRIEGPLIRRISVFGSLEKSTTTGMAILAPTAGYSAEVNVTLTPHSFDLMASGNMVLTAVGHALDVAAYAHLFKDFQRGSAEGEVSGRIDCHSAVAGLAGEGQATWYVDDSREFLQGRLSMAIFNLFGGARLEGGLFIGSNCPRERAWVLLEGGEKFGVSSAILPNPVTGIYGYGQLSISVNWYVFGGGVDISLGLGFFDAGLFGRCGLHLYGEILGGLVSASAWANLALLLGPPLYFEGSLGLRGCIAWVLCASIEITAGYGSDGFYLV